MKSAPFTCPKRSSNPGPVRSENRYSRTTANKKIVAYARTRGRLTRLSPRMTSFRNMRRHASVDARQDPVGAPGVFAVFREDPAERVFLHQDPPVLQSAHDQEK